MTRFRWGSGSARSALALVLLLLCAGPVLAQETPEKKEDEETPTRAERQTTQPAPSGLTLSGVVDPDTYHLGPGDLLQIMMWGRVSRTWSAEVSPEGALMLPSSGALPVAGRSLTDVRKDVMARLRSVFRDVSIDLRLIRPRTFFVYVTGEVKEPGPVLASGAQRVGDILTGSALLTGASRRRIVVTHVDGSSELADLELFLLAGQSTMNPWLRDGDILQVPIATEFIYVQGAVARSGKFELGPRDSLRTLFDLAGDPVPSADANRALLVRWKDSFAAESLWFGLSDVYEQRINPMLRDGDRLYIYYIPQYHLQQEATILGEVSRPGVYPIAEGRHRLSDLAAAAGGFLGNADLSTIRVFHSSRGGREEVEADAQFERLVRLSRSEMTETEYEIMRAKLAERREDFRVDWFRLKQSPELDILLRHGDVVRVDQLVNSVRVEGEVRRPGIVEFDPRRTIRQYVELVGGFSERAARGKVRVTRSVTGQSLPMRDVPAIAPGDLIWVPEKADVTIWQRLQGLLTVAAQVATIIVVVRR